jgi:hypothetical protein
MTERFSREYWELRAAEAFAVATQLSDPECRQVMLQIAASYQQIAEATVRSRAERANASDQSSRTH